MTWESFISMIRNHDEVRYAKAAPIHVELLELKSWCVVLTYDAKTDIYKCVGSFQIKGRREIRSHLRRGSTPGDWRWDTTKYQDQTCDFLCMKIFVQDWARREILGDTI